MNFTLTILVLASAFSHSAAQIASGGTIHAACPKPIEDALTRATQGRFSEAGEMLRAVDSNGDRADRLCAGLTLSRVAALLSDGGRPADAEAMAGRAVHTLEEVLSSDDRELLVPLQTLAAVQLQQGKITKARAAFQKMRSIRTGRPEERALVNAMAASLLEAEGSWPEAESQYAAAIQALKEGKRGDSADCGNLLVGMGGLYIREHRGGEARQALNEALTIFKRSSDADPRDRISLLRTSGVLYARQGEWREAQQYLADALSLADHESRVDPTVLRSLLADYAAVLRKNHRRREARTVETRLAVLRGPAEFREVVDVTDLLAGPKTGR